MTMNSGGGASIEERLARLETAEEVRTLEAEYAVAVDMNDVDRVLALCAPDIVLRVGDASWSGHDEVRQFFSDAWAANPNASRHFITNVATTRLEPDAAEATACFFYVTAIDGRSMVGWGWYADECVRRDGRLVFGSRRIHMDLLADLDSGWAEQFTRSAAMAIPIGGRGR